MELFNRNKKSGQTHHANEKARNQVLKGHGFIRALSKLERMRLP
jgi:hypothetical protein